MLGDVNGDGLSDMLLGATDRAYVVFGKAGNAEVSLADVEAGLGGFAILPEASGGPSALSVAGGGDLNRDGIADIVIGASRNAEGGANAGAVYVVWGGARGVVDLSAIAMGAGGTKVVGSAGSLAGSSVAVAPDMNGDGAAELVIGSAGLTAEAVRVLYAPTSWQPDLDAHGTNGADTLGLGDGGAHPITQGADSIYALGGNDSVSAAGGDDWLDGGAGADTLRGGAGRDGYAVDSPSDVVIEAAGEGADSMDGGAGNDLYAVDDAGDVVADASGADTIVASLDYALGAGIEGLQLTGAAHRGTGNALANLLAGGAGDDLYLVDDAGDLVIELAGGGLDSVIASVSFTLRNQIETLRLVGGATAGTGNAGANLIEGSAPDNLLSGLRGADTLVGGDGADTLIGGAQADRLVGGAGADAFFFGALADRGDTIADFVAAEDAVVVSAAGFGGGLVEGADLAAGHQFLAGAVANEAFGQFLWHAASGRLWFDADGTGAEARLLIATLTPGTALTAADIHVVA